MIVGSASIGKVAVQAKNRLWMMPTGFTIEETPHMQYHTGETHLIGEEMR
jgi:hypothetical protein